MKKIRRAEDVDSIVKAMLIAGPVLVQEHFRGIGVGVETLCRNGEVLVAFQTNACMSRCSEVEALTAEAFR